MKDSLTTEKRVCWLCEKPHKGDVCPTCGPPVPLGPTPEELRREAKARRKALEAYHGDIDGDLEGWW